MTMQVRKHISHTTNVCVINTWKTPIFPYGSFSHLYHVSLQMSFLSLAMTTQINSAPLTPVYILPCFIFLHSIYHYQTHTFIYLFIICPPPLSLHPLQLECKPLECRDFILVTAVIPNVYIRTRHTVGYQFVLVKGKNVW